jgi:cytochrome c oxidase cbb3-type subunit 1
MWREYNEMGFLRYSFSETVGALFPYYVIRLVGGLLFLGGALIMVYNLYKTIKDVPSAAVQSVKA